jgi:hypothetical protein
MNLSSRTLYSLTRLAFGFFALALGSIIGGLIGLLLRTNFEVDFDPVIPVIIVFLFFYAQYLRKIDPVLKSRIMFEEEKPEIPEHNPTD